MNVLFWIGRILFSMIFIFSGLGHFTNSESMSQYAASKGVPAPKAMVMLTGLVILLGGLSILFWWYVEIGAWLLVFFLLTAAFKIHDFWAVEDPMQRQSEQGQFMKNLAMAGAAIVFYALAQEPSLIEPSILLE